MENITIGRIVEFFPNGNKELELPNQMQTAPAMVTQVFPGTDMVNMTIFCADPRPDTTGTWRSWSIQHKSSNPADGVPYWDWLQKV